MLETYQAQVEERLKLGIVPEPLNKNQVADIVEVLTSDSVSADGEKMLDLLIHRVPPGVDDAAYVKASFLSGIVEGSIASAYIDASRAVELLGTMQGGYNVATLIACLDNTDLADLAVEQLAQTILLFDAYYDVEEKAKKGNGYAQKLIERWANAEWFTTRPKVAEKITLSVFKVPGEINTDDLSPAVDAWSRPDIPLHALAMLKNPREGLVSNPLEKLNELKEKGHPVAFVGDVVGTGSSRKSATNSVLWYIGDDIPFVPNKRTGGFCLGGSIAPIFFNTMEDSGAFPIELPVEQMNMGDVIDIYPYEGKVCRHGSDEIVSEFSLKTQVILDEVQAGGRINLIIGKGLTSRARQYLGLGLSDVFRTYDSEQVEGAKGFTLGQKMVGRACGVEGVRPNTYCEPVVTTVGSQDTTGPMTRDELKDLACLGFSADLVMQSFCHTAAYPKPIDIETQHTLPDFIMNRGGVSLRPGDGIIHSWLNRMLLPDTLGTGGDSHTRFPLGISFPAGSGMVAFAAATGVMPLDMPESVLVRFKGEMHKGITLRDLVHAIPYYAEKQGLLTIAKANKKNIFSGKILEIEGLSSLKIEQAFELSDASAERSAAGCTIKLDKEPIIEYLNSNITLLKWMISEGYGDEKTIARRISKMEEWLAEPKLLEADADAEYAAVIEIDLAEITEPLLCCPNDPDHVRPLSELENNPIDEVFIGSCMTNIGHFRAAGKLLAKYEGATLPTRLWIAPPTKMDQKQLIEEGYYGLFGQVSARTEMPGCSLCMGNQARVKDNSTVVSTSTRNFPNRLGKGADVYLASAELSAIVSMLGRLPTVSEYQGYAEQISKDSADSFRYMNFDQLDEYRQRADKIILRV